MKLLYIIKSLAVTGGQERILIDKANYLSEKYNYDITLLTYEQGNHPLAYPISDKVSHIDINCNFYRLYNYNAVKHAYLLLKKRKEFKSRIKQQIKLSTPDLVLCTTDSLFIIPAIIKAIRPAKLIVESHIARISKRYKYKWKRNAILSYAGSLIDKYTINYFRRCAAIIALTTGDAESWRPLDNVRIIPNCLTQFPEPACDNKKGKRVITAGRLSEQKGYDLLIKSWSIINKKHPDWILDIYGSGEDKNALLKSIQNNNLSDSIFIYEPVDNIYQKYQESDFYVMSSRYEGFGLVLIEAMSCGIPCVSFNCPHGPSDIIKDGEDGILVENGKIEELSEKICYLIENESIRLEMGLKAKENIKRYLPENIMPKWEKLFKSLI